MSLEHISRQRNHLPDTKAKNLQARKATPKTFAQDGAEGVFRVANSSSISVTTTFPAGLKVSIQPGSGANTTSLYYSPQTITVVIGVNNNVIWINNDNAIHTVTGTGVFDSGYIQPGQSWTCTFSTPGTYHCHCSIHPWMTGTVVVESG